MACAKTKKHVKDIMNKGNSNNPTVVVTTVASAEGTIATVNAASQQENVDEEAEKKRNATNLRKEKLYAKMRASAPVAPPQPGLQVASQPSTSAMVPLAVVPSSGPSGVASAPADPGMPTQDNEFNITPEWTDAKPSFLMSFEEYMAEITSRPEVRAPHPRARPDPVLPNREIREQQRDTGYSRGDSVATAPVQASSRELEIKVMGSGITGQQDVRDKRTDWGNPVPPLSVDLPKQDNQNAWGSAFRQQDDQEDGELTSGERRESSGRQVARVDQFPRRDHRSRSGDRGSENRDSQSRNNERRSSSTERHHRNNDMRSVHSDRQSHDYDRGAERSGSRSHHSDRMSEGSGQMSARGRGLAMTTPAWMARSGEQLGAGPVPGQAPVEDTSSRGRGRGRTLPAWITQPQQGRGP